VPATDLVVLGAWTDVLPPILNALILIMGIVLIGLVLIQRGKGGGLAGAFGGAGGSSAFGTRAGDQFTKITIIVAAIWIFLIMIMVKMVQPPPKQADDGQASPPGGDQQQSRLWQPDAPWDDRA
jgi:preprotein translocase subunit SecG